MNTRTEKLISKVEHKMDLQPEKSELADIREITIAPNLSKEERIAEFLRQIKDPCHFRCGGIIVHACYAADGPTLTECLAQLLS